MDALPPGRACLCVCAVCMCYVYLFSRFDPHIRFFSCGRNPLGTWNWFPTLCSLCPWWYYTNQIIVKRSPKTSCYSGQHCPSSSSVCLSICLSGLCVICCLFVPGLVQTSVCLSETTDSLKLSGNHLDRQILEISLTNYLLLRFLQSVCQSSVCAASF
jgi:hypothetical protein